MTRFFRHRPALDTVLGLVAVVVASTWSVAVMHAVGGDADESQIAAVSGAQPSGPPVNFTYVVGDAVKQPRPFIALAFADCPKGQVVVGGGYWTNNSALRIVASNPTPDRTGWRVALSNQPPFTKIENAMVAPYAMCAKPGVPIVLPAP
jgi:hypothetical protein